MSSQEFILIPKVNYVTEYPKTSEILYDPTIAEKAKQLTMLQREKAQTVEEDKSDATKQVDNEPEIVEKRVLKTLSMLKPSQLEKTKHILKKIYDATDVSVNEEGFITIGDRATTIEATNLLYNLQQTKKRLHDPDYAKILEKVNISPQLVANSDAKKILQPIRQKPGVRPKKKTPRKTRKRPLVEDEQTTGDSEEETSTSRPWQTF